MYVLYPLKHKQSYTDMWCHNTLCSFYTITIHFALPVNGINKYMFFFNIIALPLNQDRLLTYLYFFLLDTLSTLILYHGPISSTLLPSTPALIPWLAALLALRSLQALVNIWALSLLSAVHPDHPSSQPIIICTITSHNHTMCLITPTPKPQIKLSSSKT